MQKRGRPPGWALPRAPEPTGSQPGLWKRPFELNLDSRDLRLLISLSTPRQFSDAELELMRNELGLSSHELDARLKRLREGGILLSDNFLLPNVPALWDHYYITLIEFEKKGRAVWATRPLFPRYLEQMMNALNSSERAMVRQVYLLYGTDWDALLITSTNSRLDYQAIIEHICGNESIKRAWTMAPHSTRNVIFDPSAAPSPDEFARRVADPLRDLKEEHVTVSPGHTHAGVWGQALALGLDAKDAELLHFLASERKLSGEDLEALSQSLHMDPTEVCAALDNMRRKGLIIKERTSLLNTPRLYDDVYITWIKVKLDHTDGRLKGWEHISQSFKELALKHRPQIVREAYTMFGTPWDIMIISMANSREDLTRFLDEVAALGWVDTSWTMWASMLPGTWFFNPISIPPLADFRESVLRPGAKAKDALGGAR